MIRNWGIRSRVLLLALVPVVCLGFVLGTYLTRVRVHDLHASEQALGDTLATQLASASEFGVFSNNVRILRTLAQAVSREPGVESITITDRYDHILAQVIHPTRQGRGLINNATQRIGNETGLANTLTFTRPIILQSIPVGGLNELLKNDGKTPVSLAGQFQVLGKVTVKLSEAHYAARQTQIIVNGGIIMLSCLALSILLALVIGGSVAVPITRVIEMVSRFSSGDHATRVPERSGGEIGQLESGINLMAANAERSQQELKIQVNQATAELRETMDEMEVKNVELDLARKRALQASRAKSEFLSNMSHEIRTPMNAIVGFAGLLAKTRLNKDQRDYLDTVQHSATILLALIDDVLGLQSLEAGKPIQPVAFNLRELLEQAITLLAPEAYQKELELISYLPVDLPVNYMGDAVKISRVLINLLSNAVKFTEQGHVKLSARAIKTSMHAITLRISVQDTGIGIQQEHIKELFKPFTMLNTVTGQRYSGTGLGLAISRQLMDALGGTLNVFSRPGEGSEFRMELALDLLPASPRLLPANSHGRALLYESQPGMTTAMQSRLEGFGHTVVACNNFSRLSTQLHSATKAGFDLLILSLSYNEVRDCSKFSGLRRGGKTPPMIVLINSLESSVQQRISKAVDGVCLPKCVDTPTLEEKIRRLLPRYSSEQVTKPRGLTIIPRPLIGRNVLVVEDNRINRRLISLQLRELGADVMQAENGAAALACFADKRPDVILLDMRLGRETGLEVAKKLVQAAKEYPVPILMLSATREEVSFEVSRSLGIRRWLLKPVDEQVLEQALLAAVLAAPPNTPAKSDSLEELKTALTRLRPEILAMLRQDLPKQQQAILGAWERNDIVALQEGLHILHGTAAVCRLVQLKAYCNTMESMLIKQSRIEYILPFKMKLKEEITRVIALLETGNHETDGSAQSSTYAG